MVTIASEQLPGLSLSSKQECVPFQQHLQQAANLNASEPDPSAPALSPQVGPHLVWPHQGCQRGALLPRDRPPAAVRR